MEKCVLQIKTGMYGEPFFAEGTYSEEKGILKFETTDGKSFTIKEGGDNE